MKRSTVLGALLVCVTGMCGGAVASAQNPETQTIDAFRTRSDIGTGDQDRIARWIQYEVNNFSSFTEFRGRFAEQYNHAGNSSQFKLQFASQSANVAGQSFGNASLSGDVAHAMAQALVDMNRIETHPGLVTGLGSSDNRARYLSAKGLVTLQRAIGADNSLFQQTVTALRDAGLKESSGVVLGRIYGALSYQTKLDVVFDTFVQLFDVRLAHRRQPGVTGDGAELYAFEFFRAASVRNTLSQTQKEQLVQRLAVFLRLDAERYDTTNLSFNEVDRLERLLDAAEEVLAGLAGNGGAIRDAMAGGGYASRGQVRAEAYRWVGDPTANTPGALSQAPWNVPGGAP